MSIITLLQAEPALDNGYKETRSLLEKLLAAFGGSEFFFQPGENILLLLDLTRAESGDSGCNADIRLTYALAAMAREKGVSSITCAYRPAPGVNARELLEISGYSRLSAVEGLTLLDLNQASTFDRQCPLGLTANSLPVSAPLLQADVVISLAKFRVEQGLLTGGAMSSLLAISPHPLDLPEESQQRRLADLYNMAAPDLFLIDCLPGSKGFQPDIAPSVMAAADGAAADSVLCGLAGINSQEQAGLCLAAQYGLGSTEPGAIVIYGDQPKKLLKLPENEKDTDTDTDNDTDTIIN